MARRKRVEIEKLLEIVFDFGKLDHNFKDEDVLYAIDDLICELNKVKTVSLGIYIEENLLRKTFKKRRNKK